MSSTVSTAIPHGGSPLRALGLAVEPYLYSAPALILIAACTDAGAPGNRPLLWLRDIQLLKPMSGGLCRARPLPRPAGRSEFLECAEEHGPVDRRLVALQFLLGLTLALLLNRPFPGRGLGQALVFLPWAVPAFLSGLDWAWLFNPVPSACAPTGSSPSG